MPHLVQESGVEGGSCDMVIYKVGYDATVKQGVFHSMGDGLRGLISRAI